MDSNDQSNHMNAFRRILSRWRGSKEIEYPLVLQLSEIAPATLQFKVYSSVEHFRIAEYGGERDYLELFLSHVKPTDVVFDIGASVGLFTVYAGKLINQGEVFSFEPDPENRLRLLENIKMNRLRNVKIVEWAVTDQEGETILYSDGASGYAPSLARKETPGAPTGELKIKTCSLDIAISRNELSIPDILKVDIEGAEALCLNGATQLLTNRFAKRPRLIFLEIHPEFLPNFQSSSEEVQKTMLDFDYKVLWFKERNKQQLLCYKAGNCEL